MPWMSSSTGHAACEPRACRCRGCIFAPAREQIVPKAQLRVLYLLLWLLPCLQDTADTHGASQGERSGDEPVLGRPGRTPASLGTAAVLCHVQSTGAGRASRAQGCCQALESAGPVASRAVVQKLPAPQVVMHTAGQRLTVPRMPAHPCKSIHAILPDMTHNAVNTTFAWPCCRKPPLICGLRSQGEGAVGAIVEILLCRAKAYAAVPAPLPS